METLEYEMLDLFLCSLVHSSLLTHTLRPFNYLKLGRFILFRLMQVARISFTQSNSSSLYKSTEV